MSICYVVRERSMILAKRFSRNDVDLLLFGPECRSFPNDNAEFLDAPIGSEL